jgi:hypothetical protein
MRAEHLLVGHKLRTAAATRKPAVEGSASRPRLALERDQSRRVRGATGQRGSSMSTTPELRTFVIRRRAGWGSPEDLQEAAARSAIVGDNEMSTDIRWIRSYVVIESDGRLGTVCIYQASSPEKIREHATRAGLPAHEIIEVADTVIVRPDPLAVGA